jgi:chromosome partitioning protein
MRIITSINAKGGCGKSTIAVNIAAALAQKNYRTLLIDLDPQAQVTEWLHAGDARTIENTIVAVLAGQQSLTSAVQSTKVPNLFFVPSAKALEQLGRKMEEDEDYRHRLTNALTSVASDFDFAVLDSPNQVSPVMENAIVPTDLFIVPFESTKAVKSYADFYELVLELRGTEPHILHVLNKILYKRERTLVLALMEVNGITPARSEIRCSRDLSVADNYGGSVFHYRPNSTGAKDIQALLAEALEVLGVIEPVSVTIVDHDKVHIADRHARVAAANAGSPQSLLALEVPPVAPETDQPVPSDSTTTL